MTKIKCANPKAQYLSKKDEIDKKISETLNGNSYILGENVRKLEEEFAEFITVKHSIGVANGTDAIEIALRALEIGTGDEVITVSHTATATVSAILCAGAIPVLVDIDEDLFTINHEEIKSWRRQKSIERTLERRIDLVSDKILKKIQKKNLTHKDLFENNDDLLRNKEEFYYDP